MKAAKIRIKNLFGIEELNLEGKDYEIIGDNRLGKTSVIEAIRYALRNKSDKDIILRRGANEGEILIETDTGVTVHRKERIGKVSVDTVKEGKTPITRKESFLRSLFSELQLNPIEFISLPKEEQNRIILNLIDFKWDMDWIKEQFGEIPPEIDYDQNILKVLSDIQSEDSYYFRTRQEINREARNKQAFITEIAETLPENYRAEDWKDKSLSEIHTKIEKIRESNRKIEKAQILIENQEDKMRAFDSDRKIALAALDKETSEERSRTEKDILRLQQQIKSLESELSGLEIRKKEKAEKIELQYQAEVSKFEASIEEHKPIAKEKIKDVSKLLEEAAYTERMKGYIGEYNRMKSYQEEIGELNLKANSLTEKIEKARTLPAEILSRSKLPLDNLTIENGIPLINGLPISNLSEGEKLELCVDIANLQKNSLNLLLIDGAEKLSDENRKKLYSKCKEKGVQFIATRTTNDSELIVLELNGELKKEE